MNAIDLLAILFLAGWIVWGVRRGFLLASLELAGFSLSIGLALIVYPVFGSYLAERIALARSIANLASFLIAFAAFRTAFAVVLELVGDPLSTWTSAHRWKFAEKVIGSFPGALEGLIWLSFIFAFLTWFPFSSVAKDGIADSQIGKSLADATTAIEPQIERLLGSATRDTIGFTTIRKTDEKRRIRIPKGARLSIDAKAEERMLQKVNEARTRAGLSPLTMDRALQRVARKHSEEMFRLGYFSHDSPVSGSPFDRFDRAGIKYFIAGENIAYAQNVDLANDGLMSSKLHRENMLTSEFEKAGIGVISAGIYGEMFTQDFTD